MLLPKRQWPLNFWHTNWPTMSKALDAIRDNTTVYPLKENIFKALEVTPLNKVKVVILGQDPYHTKGYANGLAFSTYPHIKPIPPSLRNIYTELSSDCDTPMPRSGDLTQWASQGVLLFNASALTVEQGKPLSHEYLGWSKLTYEITRRLSGLPRNIVWIMWGRKAQEYSGVIDTRKHLLIEACHPSPRNNNLDFFGHKPFTRCNDFLEEMGEEPINWRLP